MPISRRLRAGRASIALVALLLLVGCTSIQVTSDHDPGADFSKLRSYAWAPVHDDGSSDSRVDNDLLDKRVREAVNRELAARGFGLVPKGQADFWITYHAGVESKVDVQTLYRSYPYRPGYVAWGGYSETVVREFDQGTLILDIVSPRSSQLIWRGTAQAEVHESSSTEKRTRLVNDAVSRMLAKFPPESK